MRLAHCIRRWLGLRSHYVARIEETPEAIVAEIEAVGHHLPRCGQCGRAVRRTKGRMPRRQWRDLKIRDRPLPPSPRAEDWLKKAMGEGRPVSGQGQKV